MVSPIGKMEHQEFGPPWLIPMLRADYFGSCRFHGDANKSECNLYCLDCCGDSLCSYCLIHHKDHRVVQLDRFIPNRSAMDFHYAHCMLTQPKKGKENLIASSPAKEAYRRRLADSLNMNTTRILAFRNKPPPPTDAVPSEWSLVQQANPVKARRYIPQLRTLRGCHQSQVGSMDWNNHILTTRGMDGRIVNNDVRIRAHIVETYSGHHQEVCGLKCSASGQQLVI